MKVKEIKINKKYLYRGKVVKVTRKLTDATNRLTLGGKLLLNNGHTTTTNQLKPI